MILQKKLLYFIVIIDNNLFWFFKGDRSNAPIARGKFGETSDVG